MSMRGLAWSPDSVTLAMIGLHEDLRCWQPSRLNDVARYVLWSPRDQHFSEEEYGIDTVTWSPDGKAVATSAYLGPVFVWEATTRAGKMICRGSYRAVSWSPDGAFLVSAHAFEPLIALWRVS